MGVKISLDDKVMIAALGGDLDHHTAKDIRESIDAYVEKTNPEVLKIDFSMVQFMDSSGIGLIIGRYKLMCLTDGKLRVVNVPKRIEKMVKLSGLMRLGIFEDSNEEIENKFVKEGINKNG